MISLGISGKAFSLLFMTILSSYSSNCLDLSLLPLSFDAIILSRSTMSSLFLLHRSFEELVLVLEEDDDDETPSPPPLSLRPGWLPLSFSILYSIKSIDFLVSTPSNSLFVSEKMEDCVSNDRPFRAS